MFEQPANPCQWFHAAARCYVDNHQGCPWCHGANRVYRSTRHHVVEYHCGACDFFACHEPDTDRYFMGPGHQIKSAKTAAGV